MRWLDDLRSQIGDLEIRGGRARAAARVAAQRRQILKMLDQNIAYLQGPKETRGIGPHKVKKPELLFKHHGNKTAVWLPYLDQRIALDRVHTEVVVPTNRVHDVLFAIRKALEAGDFDDQICAIKSVADLKAAKTATEAAKP